MEALPSLTESKLQSARPVAGAGAEGVSPAVAKTGHRVDRQTEQDAQEPRDVAASMRLSLAVNDVPAMLSAFHLGSWGRLSDGPVASGRLGSIWRLDTESGSWAVKQVGDASDAELAEVLEGAALQDAALAGVPTPAVRRTPAGDVIADRHRTRVRLHAWADLEEPDIDLDPVELGQLVAALHRVDFAGTIGPDPWYADPVGVARWHELMAVLHARGAPFAGELDALVPELVALEAYLGGPPRALRTCHRDLWADNVRRTPDGDLCVFDFDNTGLADPSQELALVLVEYGAADSTRARTIRAAYAEAGGPGRVEGPQDFAMPIAQLAHIVDEGCRRWLIATTDAERTDNEAWVREFIDRPLTRDVIEALLAGG
jgi:Ser/Thr protein kinase RdoA (MazF antagonist)